MAITGKLENWYVQEMTGEEYILIGNIYEDVRGRFQDGTTIHTSGIYNDVFPPKELREDDVVYTRNSQYQLGKSMKQYTKEQINAKA